MGDCFHLQFQGGGWDRIGCTVFKDCGRTLLDSEAPPWLVFGDCMSLHCALRDLTVCCRNEKVDLWICFACWPFLTVPSPGSGDGPVVRAPDSWSKGRGFESRQERRENFFPMVNFLCWLFISVFVHLRATAVARKISRSFCQKCRWQVTTKYACTLRQERRESARKRRTVPNKSDQQQVSW